MAKFFNQDIIDLFKECFFFHAKRGYVTDKEELALIMRSLSYSPTLPEVDAYLQKYSTKADGKVDFASFLEVMHDHVQVENSRKEILQGFRAQDTQKRGYVSAQEAKLILMKIGEGLSRHEVDNLFREAGVSGGQLRYQEFVDTVMTPAPDY